MRFLAFPLSLLFLFGSDLYTLTSGIWVKQNASSAVKSKAGASDYYVSVTGSDKPCPASPCGNGSASKPWATIAYASRKAQPGWTIHVRPGTYSGAITTTASGTSSKRIRYVSDTKWGAVVTCSDCSQVWVQNGSYVDIVNFEITSADSATWEGLAWNGAYGLIQGNKVHDIACRCAICQRNGGDGIGTYRGATHTIIDSNMVYNVAVGSPFNTLHGIYVNWTQYVTISNNIVFHNAVWGINLHHQTGSYYATIVNNTVFNNSGGINVEGRTSSYIANNILAFNTAGPNKKHALNECCQLNTGSTNVYTHNLIYGNTDSIYFLDPASINDSPVNKEPQFIKYTGDETGDYRLQSGSPAKSAGTAAQAPRTDYAGSPRAPREGACDIGAYEDR